MSGRGQDDERPPRADFKDAAGWTALGLAALIGSIRMDRLQSQHINPLTIPGLVPGLLGLAMMALGLVLGVRSWRRGALRDAEPKRGPLAWTQRKRVVIAIALCVGFAAVLVGHGLPFWLASSIYATVSILIYRGISPDPDERRIGVRAIAQALLVGVGASVIIWLVFEQLFLVRLP